MPLLPNEMMRSKAMHERQGPTKIPAGHLDEWGMCAKMVRVSVVDKDQCEETFAFRIFLPKSVAFGDAICQPFLSRLEEMILRTVGDERKSYERVLGLLRLHCAHPDLELRNERAFNLQTLQFSETFVETARMLKCLSAPLTERLVRFSGKTTDPTHVLLNGAFYEKPELELPVNLASYLTFRDHFLDEVDALESWADEQVNRYVEERRQAANSSAGHPTPNGDDQAKDPSELSQLSSAELMEIPRPLRRQLLKKVLGYLWDSEKHLAPFLLEAESLMAPIDHVLSQGAIALHEADGTTPSEDYMTCIDDHLDPVAVDQLLERICASYRETYDLPSVEIIETRELDVQTLEKASAAADAMHEDSEAPRCPAEAEEYFEVLAALASDDPRDKWNVLVWLTARLSKREECVRLLSREAEDIYSIMVDYGFRQFYRSIRTSLTRAEKRAFALMYLRHAGLGLTSTAFHPVLSSFFFGMDKETQGMVVGNVILKLGVGDPIWRAALDERWRAFLKFYPSWLQSVRFDDNESYQQDAIDPRLVSLDHVEFFLTAGESAFPSPDASAFSAGAELLQLARRSCTKKQVRCLELRLLGRTEAEIGSEMGISQQAVSRLTQRATQQIQESRRQELQAIRKSKVVVSAAGSRMKGKGKR